MEINNFAEHSNFSLKKRIIMYLFEKDDDLEEREAKLPLSKSFLCFVRVIIIMTCSLEGQCALSEFGNP